MPAGAHRNQQKKIDSNNIATVFRKGNAITKLLTDAIQKENAGETGVYYWKKNEAQNLYARAGVQFPGSAVQDGLIHSILKKDSPVNRKFVEQTETRQFQRWFGKSKVVDEDGKPLVMYHGTSEKNGDFFIFDSSKAKKKGGLGLAALGKGNYFTSERLTGNERYGKRVIQTFLRIENPFVYEGGESFREQVAKKIDKNAMTMTQEEIQEVMRSKGYDGVIKYDSSGKPNVAVAFDSNQIKSATDNVGTFANIRYFVSLCRNGLSAAPKHPSLH